MPTPQILIPVPRNRAFAIGGGGLRVLVVGVAAILLGAAPPFRAPVAGPEPITPAIPSDLPVRDGPRLTLAHPDDPDEHIGGFRFLHGGRTLCGGNWESPLILWDARTGKVKAKLVVESGWFTDRSPDGKILATSIGDGTVIQLSDASSLKPIATLKGHEGSIIGLNFLPDNRRLLSLSRDGTARMWDVKTRKQLYSVVRSEQRVTQNYALSPDASLLVTWDGQIITLWDARTGKKLRSATLYKDFGIGGVFFSPDGKYIACHTNFLGDGCVWRVKDLRKVGEAPEGEVYGAHIGVMLPNERVVVNTGEEVLVWNYGSKRIEARLRAHSSVVYSMLLSADGKRMVSMDEDGVGYVWDVKTWSPLLKLTGMGGRPGNPVMSPDGLSLAYARLKGAGCIHDLTVPAKKPAARPK
jgi:WD40 repeat protein